MHLPMVRDARALACAHEKEGSACKEGECTDECNACALATQALKREQLAALVGAADPTNPALLLIAAFCAKNLQNGNRAAQEYLLDWSELTEHTNRDGKTIGFSTEFLQLRAGGRVLAASAWVCGCMNRTCRCAFV